MIFTPKYQAFMAILRILLTSIGRTAANNFIRKHTPMHVRAPNISLSSEKAGRCLSKIIKKVRWCIIALSGDRIVLNLIPIVFTGDLSEDFFFFFFVSCLYFWWLIMKKVL